VGQTLRFRLCKGTCMVLRLAQGWSQQHEISSIALPKSMSNIMQDLVVLETFDPKNPPIRRELRSWSHCGQHIVGQLESVVAESPQVMLGTSGMIPECVTLEPKFFPINESRW
jgi:hypothetical protein